MGPPKAGSAWIVSAGTCSSTPANTCAGCLSWASSQLRCCSLGREGGTQPAPARPIVVRFWQGICCGVYRHALEPRQAGARLGPGRRVGRLAVEGLQVHHGRHAQLSCARVQLCLRAGPRSASTWVWLTQARFGLIVQDPQQLADWGWECRAVCWPLLKSKHAPVWVRAAQSGATRWHGCLHLASQPPASPVGCRVGRCQQSAPH